MTDDSDSVDDTVTCHPDQMEPLEEVVREIEEKQFPMVQTGGDEREWTRIAVLLGAREGQRWLVFGKYADPIVLLICSVFT